MPGFAEDKNAIPSQLVFFRKKDGMFMSFLHEQSSNMKIMSCSVSCTIAKPRPQ